jgi:hypothetical protein
MMAANRSSFLLAVLFIANPFILLFYQNCSVAPNSHTAGNPQKFSKAPASENKVQSFDKYRN